MKFKYRWWGKGDIDASIGIFFDGFSKILSATGIMLFVFGMPADIVLGKIVPGVGLAIFAGNLWYFYEAWALAKKEQRQDVTAQPFGIGASQLTGWLYLIMGPVYWQTGDAELAFQVGLASSLIGGMIEVLGGFIGRWIVKVVPTAPDGQHGLFGAGVALFCGHCHGVRQAHLCPAAFLHGHHRLSGQGRPAVPEDPHRRHCRGAGRCHRLVHRQPDLGELHRLLL